MLLELANSAAVSLAPLSALTVLWPHLSMPRVHDFRSKASFPVPLQGILAFSGFAFASFLSNWRGSTSKDRDEASRSFYRHRQESRTNGLRDFWRSEHQEIHHRNHGN